MVNKLPTKKSIAVIMGLVALLYTVLSIFLRDSHFLGEAISPFFEGTAIYLFTLFVSVPAYFLRKEIHDFWFKWMMCVYMPIACVVVFYVASHEKKHILANGAETVVTIGLASLLFFILSLALIIAKRDSLNRRK